jgi:hypothetical protein
MVTPRRTLIFGFVLGVVLLASAACAGTIPNGTAAAGGPTSSGPASSGPALPRASVTSGAPASRRPSSALASASVAPSLAPTSFPSSPRAYAEAVLAAWSQRQVTRLGDLTTSPVQSQILEFPGLPDQHWTYQRCDGAAGSSYCSFGNTDGDMITLRLVNQQVGTAHAATEVRFDRTVYANDAGEYVKGFVEAWRNANTARMEALSSPSEAEYFTHYAPPDTYSVCTVEAGSTWQVRVFNFDGANYLMRVSSTDLGNKHAIAGHIDPASVPCT